MDKYKTPTVIIFNVSPSDIITTSPVEDNDDYEPGVDLPDLEFPRALNDL